MTRSGGRPDAAIERMLGALGGAEVPAGLERRVLAALEEQAALRADGRGTRSGWREALGERRFALPIAAAAGAMVLLLALGSVGLRHGSRAVVADRRTVGPTLSQAREAGRDESGAHPGEVLAGGRVRSVRLRRGGQRTDAPRHKNVTDFATFAPSLPAPPMPLTEQERLMLRLVHRGDPVELAELNPALREERTAAERAEFQRFFAPSIKGDHE